ncbi:hypothetical protein GCM10010449_06090 [Streptomyces rectiviolaceus]|uniref:Uncharacterized protein n=1 Tax=Streptomyces rectiviolaceus TaxID=332591 RepID=A0ABP6M6Z8_9ACTN
MTPGFDMNLYAYTLPTGAPGRPFVRVADGDDTSFDYFDTSSMEALQTFRDALIGTLAGLTESCRRSRHGAGQRRLRHWSGRTQRSAAGRAREKRGKRSVAPGVILPAGLAR